MDKYEEALKNICANCEKQINETKIPIRENEISNANCGHQLCPYRHIDNSYCEDIKTLQHLIDICNQPSSIKLELDHIQDVIESCYDIDDEEWKREQVQSPQ